MDHRFSEIMKAYKHIFFHVRRTTPSQALPSRQKGDHYDASDSQRQGPCRGGKWRTDIYSYIRLTNYTTLTVDCKNNRLQLPCSRPSPDWRHLRNGFEVFVDGGKELFAEHSSILLKVYSDLNSEAKRGGVSISVSHENTAVLL